MSLYSLPRGCLTFLLLTQLSLAQDVLVEAEGFEVRGGWLIDTQFIDLMGSPYLLAHGMGQPVADAEATVRFPEHGRYRVFVRTLDWVAKFGAEGSPGRFEVLVNGEPLSATFGTVNSEWHWQPGGEVDIDSDTASVKLHDLTGYEGRCDAILFTKSTQPPPNDDEVLAPWRKALLGHSSAQVVEDG